MLGLVANSEVLVPLFVCHLALGDWYWSGATSHLLP